MFWYRKKAKDKPKKQRKDDVLPLFESAGIKTPRKVDYKGQLDRWFSKYIRLRDAMPNGYFQCISCGRILPISKADAGHYISRVHTATRYDEDNVHSECQGCNRMSADHIVFYRENLVRKIGQNRFDMLMVKAKTTCKMSSGDYIMLLEHYKKEVKRLEKEKGIKI